MFPKHLHADMFSHYVSLQSLTELSYYEALVILGTRQFHRLLQNDSQCEYRFPLLKDYFVII